MALLLVSSANGELRRKHTETLVQGYFENVLEWVTRLGEDATSLGWERTRVMREMRRSQLLALLLCLGSVDVALGDVKAEKRLHDALEDARDQGLLDQDFIDEQLD